jgi:hypothetical protein
VNAYSDTGASGACVEPIHSPGYSSKNDIQNDCHFARTSISLAWLRLTVVPITMAQLVLSIQSPNIEDVSLDALRGIYGTKADLA